MGKLAPGEATDDPPPVEDGTGLLPFVPRSLVASVAVTRLVYESIGDNGEVRELAMALPRRFTASDDEVTLAEFCGGGFFQAQARDESGRFLKGYPVRRFAVDGPEKELRTGDAPAGMPPAPPPPPAARQAPALAAPAVPLFGTDAVQGMPRAVLDVPDLTAEQRAWMAPFMATLSFANHSWREAVNVAVQAARDGAEAEKEAARAAVDTSKLFVEKVTGPAVLQQGEAVKGLIDELAAVRADRDRIATELRTTREEREAARIEAARLRALLESNGQIPPKASGAMAVVELLITEAFREFGAPAAALIASRMGVGVDELRALTAGGRAAETRPDDRPASSA